MLKVPEDINGLFYFTRRTIGEGRVIAWAKKMECPSCHKALMGKPRGKDGRVMIRAKYYECPECGFRMDKKEYEDGLTAEIVYTCPYCGFEGEAVIPFRRKNIKGVQTLRFVCGKCGRPIDITKKMKEPKK